MTPSAPTPSPDETRYRILFDGVPIGLYRSSPAGALLEVNPAMVAMLGYRSPEELLAGGARNLYAHEGDRGRWQELLHSSGHVRDFEVQLRRRDGSPLWVRESAFAERGADGRVLCYHGSVEDITEELTRLDALNRSEQRFRALIERAAEIITVLGVDGTVLYDSPAILEVLGYHPSERVGRSAFELAHPDDLPRVRAEFQDLLREPSGTRRLEVRMRHKEGSWRTLAVMGTNLTADPAIGGVVVNGRDVTEQALAEEEVRRQRGFYEEILDNVNVDIAVFDPDLRYEYVNATAVRDPAVRAWMIGKNDVDYCRERGKPDTVARERMRWMQTAIDELRIEEFEEELPTPDGGTKHMVRRFSPVVGADGTVLRLIGYGFDITARKTAEQALWQREEELRQAKKLEAIGQLAGGVAHDFNNLLTAIQGNTQLLIDKAAQGSEALQELEEIAMAADRAAALTRQLLAFGRKQVLQPIVLDLNTVLRELEQLLNRVVGEKTQLKLILDPDLWLIRADRGQLEQVLLNLTLNARDAMPTGGTLRIRTTNSRSARASSSRAGGAAEPDHVVLSVCDTGCGMDARTQERAFEPFFTTKEPGKGTGLGLSTVYGIVEQSGGEIWIESELGRGTCVAVRLPRTAEPRHEPAATIAKPIHPHRTGTVLLVEDEPAVRSFVKRVLQRRGYEVLEAADAEAALAIAADHGDEIDLLLSDIVMPGIDGPELREQLLQLRPGLPTLFMSGYSDEAIAHSGVLDHGAGFIEKPFRADDLVHKIGEVLSRGGGSI